MFKFGQDIGIDWGHSTVSVQSVFVAVDNNNGEVLAVGQEARRMLR